MSSRYGEVLGDTLALVNTVRQAFGHEPLLELPDARSGISTDCLYYRALKDVGVTSVGSAEMKFNSPRIAEVVAELWGTEAHGNSVRSPKQITNVIGRFDGHQLGHYEV